jgi:GT2 family glycosyltransferase
MEPRFRPARVCIVIVNWNTRELLERCLMSVAGEVAAGAAGEIEVIVVDNASTDASADLVQREYPWVKLIANEHNLGFARANNQAIEVSRSDFVLLLNSDTVVRRGAIGTLTEFMERRVGVGAAGAKLLNTDGSLQHSCRPMLTPEREFWRLTYLDRLWPRASYAMASWDEKRPQEVEVMMGACMMLRREALDEVGLLDESYFMYTEEVDLCYRLAYAGWELWYVPLALVTHYGQASSRQVAQEMFVQLYRSKVEFYRKTGGERHAHKFKKMLRMAYVPRLAVTRLLAPFSRRFAQQASNYSKLLGELSGM